MRSVLLIRHGESEINAADPPVVGGRSGWAELTERGVAQSVALGEALAARGEPCDRVVASTTVRAQQTARYCLQALGRPEWPVRRIEVADALTELSQGEWENRLRSDIYTPTTLAGIEVDPWRFCPPGGESQEGVFLRASAWLEREVVQGEARHVWAFGHGVVIKVLLAGLFDRDRRTAWRTPIDNASLTHLEFDGTWRLRAENLSVI
jgi:broad specificity phosphatase PhoE